MVRFLKTESEQNFGFPHIPTKKQTHIANVIVCQSVTVIALDASFGANYNDKRSSMGYMSPQ